MAIDVGPECRDRESGIATFTLVQKENPANATGTIDSVCVYARVNMFGIKFASFIDEGSNVLSTNGDTNGSNLSCLSGESPKTFNAPGDFTAFDIGTGEYIGLYFSSGEIESDSGGGQGVWYQSGDNIPASSVIFNTIAGYVQSIYATGVESGVGILIPIVHHHKGIL